MVNYQYAELFKKDSIDKQLTIETDDKTTKITNVELHQEQFELMESICSEAELTIGSCEAAVLKFTVSNIFHADIVVGNALAATSGNALHHCNSDFVMQIKQNNLKQECFSTKFYKIIYFSAKHALHFRAKTDSRAANAYRQACFFPPECKVHYTIKTYLRKKTNKTTQQCTTKT